MKNKLYSLLTMFLFAAFLQTHAQPGCPAVSVPDTTVCGSGCIPTTATPVSGNQTNTYTVQQIPYSPFPTNGSNQVFINIDDRWSPIINMPFNFCFFGNSYNRMVIGSNGLISFNTAYANGYCPWPISNAIPSASNPINSIMAPWHDIDPSISSSSPNVNWQLYGTAPCRTMVVTWNSVAMYSCSNLIATQQIVLYETTNIIETYIASKPLCSGWNSGAAIHGIQNAAGNAAFVVPGRNYPTQWSATNDAWAFYPNGAPNYQIYWYEQGNSTPIDSGLTATLCPTSTTNYIVEAIYNNCGSGTVTVYDTATILFQNTPLSLAMSSTDVSCNGGADGTAAVAVSNGVTPYVYAWNSSPPQATPTATGLPAGTYTVLVTDSIGCSATDSITVNEPPAITLGLTSTDPLCFGANGSATVSAAGGVGGFSYNWNSSPSQSTATAVLPSGTFSVTVTDGNGCTADTSVTLTQPTQLTTSTSFTAVSCNGMSDGTATVTPNGGTAPYTYSWSPGNQTTATISNLAAGNYSVTVTDANGCTSNNSVTVTSPPALSGDIGNDTTICNGSSLTLSATSWGGATYLWSPGNVSGPAYTVNTTGQYSVIINDGNGCLYYDTIHVTIDLPPTLTLVNNPTDMCEGNPIVFTASPSGLAGYIFNINGVNQPVTTNPVLNIPNANTTQTVTVTGITALGCTSAVSLPAVTNVVPTPSGTVNTTTVCEGESTTLTLSNIVGGNTITWTGADGLSGSGSSVNYVYPSGAGTYTWSVVLDNGLCTTTLSGVVPVKPLPDAPTASDEAVCEGDDAHFEAILPGGRYEWFDAPVGGQQLATGRNLTIPDAVSSGTYYVQTVVNGCTSPRSPVNLTVNLPPVADFTATPDTSDPQDLPNAEFAFQNLSTGGATWAWSFGDGNTDTTENPIHIYAETGLFPVRLIATSADGCRDTIVRFPFVVENPIGLWVPTGFTPNGDGLNDLFEIKFIGYLGYEIQIFDRWGKLIFDNQGNSTLFWDGSDGVVQVPEGVYVYRISAIAQDGSKVPRSGSITILR